MIIRICDDQTEDSEAKPAVESEAKAEASRVDALEGQLTTVQTELDDLKGNIQPRLEKLEASMERIEAILAKLAKRWEE